MKSIFALGFVGATLCAVVSSAVLALSPPVPACRSYPDGVMICGGGPNELRVVVETISPDGKLGIGWRAPADEGSEVASSFLVRLKDFSLSPLHGDIRWGSKTQLANHVSVNAKWTANSSALIEAVGAKWELTSLKLYRVDASGAVASPVDLSGLVEDGVRAKLKALKADAGAYVFDFASGVKTAASNDKIVLPLIAQVPKSENDPDYRFDVTVSVDEPDGGAKIVSVAVRPN